MEAIEQQSGGFTTRRVLGAGPASASHSRGCNSHLDKAHPTSIAVQWLINRPEDLEVSWQKNVIVSNKGSEEDPERVRTTHAHRIGHTDITL